VAPAGEEGGLLDGEAGDNLTEEVVVEGADEVIHLRKKNALHVVSVL
jgi:hypothetical protein